MTLDHLCVQYADGWQLRISAYCLPTQKKFDESGSVSALFRVFCSERD